MKIFSCNSFTGGMNDWIHPMLLESNIAAKLVNADISTGKLVPVKRPLKLAGTTPDYYGNYGSHNRSAIKYNGRYYWSDNRAAEAPYYGGYPENFLGVPYPTYGENKNVQVDFIYADSTEGTVHLSGEYKYCVTFVTENGWEGAPGSLSSYEVGATIEEKNPKVTVSWSDSRVSYAKVYRTMDHGADFFCVGEIHTSGNSFTDTVPDETAVLLNPLTSEDNYPPPDAGKYLTENNGVFFLAQGPLLYFSAVGNPHAWPATQFITFDDEITGITPEFMGILVFTRNKAFRVIGADNPQTVQKIYIPGNHGCINWRSIAMLNNAPVWLSNDGICIWDGNTISVPSYRVIKTDELAEKVKWAVAANDCYYLFLRRYAIVYDIRNGGIFYKLGMTYEYAWFDVGSGVFYLQDAGGIYKYGGSEEALSMQYSSPYIGGNESGVKIYHEIYLVCQDEVKLSAAVDGVPLWNEPVSVPAGKQRIKFPLHSVGHFLSVSLESPGNINELQVLYD